MELWNPSHIETELWLDAADLNSIITPDGSEVTEWQDKSGNERHAEQATTLKKPKLWPFNDKHRIRFSEEYLTIPNSKAAFSFIHQEKAEVYAVARFVTDWNIHYMMGNMGNASGRTGFFLGQDGRSLIVGEYGSVAAGVISNGAGFDGYVAAHFDPASNNAAPPSWEKRNLLRFGYAHLFQFSLDAKAEPNLRIMFGSYDSSPAGGSVLTGSFTNNPPTYDLQIGAAGGDTTGEALDIMELIVVRGALDSDSRARLNSYLAHKWGFEKSAVSYYNPYRDAPPEIEIQQASKVSGIVQINGTPAQRTVRAFGYDPIVHTLDGKAVDMSKSLGQAISDPTTGEYTIDLLTGYDQEVFVVAFDDYGVDFVPDLAVAVGDRVHPTIPDGHVYECTSAGTLPSTEPTWVTDTEISQSYGTASMIARVFYRPLVHGPIEPKVATSKTIHAYVDGLVLNIHDDYEDTTTAFNYTFTRLSRVEIDYVKNRVFIVGDDSGNYPRTMAFDLEGNFLWAIGSNDWHLDLAIDRENEYLYMLDVINTSNEVTRVSYDGTGQTQILYFSTNVRFIEVDPVSNFIFGVDENGILGYIDMASATNGFPSDAVTTITLNSYRCFGIKKSNQTVWFCPDASTSVHSINYDGTGLTDEGIVCDTESDIYVDKEENVYYNKNGSVYKHDGISESVFSPAISAATISVEEIAFSELPAS